MRSRLLPPLVTVAVISCNVFETREPESPGQSGSAFLPPTEPDIVLTNLASAISERNTDNYLRSFVDSSFSRRTFEFIPTQEAQGQFPTLFAAWTVESERQYFENLRSQMIPSAFSSLFLTQGRYESLQSDSAVYNATYQLIFQHDRSEIPTEARGSLLFYLATDERNHWVIHRWADFKTASDLSWSELKGRFSN